jgi:hypothetical protein
MNERSSASASSSACDYPSSVVQHLKMWYTRHHEESNNNPTLSAQEKAQLMSDTGLNEKQLNDWFVSECKKQKDIKLPSSTVEILKQSFDVNRWPSKVDRLRIASEAGITEAQLHSWFNAERSRRKHDADATVPPSKSDNLDIEVCKAWYDAHQSNPYPTKVDIEQLANTTGLTEQRIKNWFRNERVRRGDTKPRSSRGDKMPRGMRNRGKEISDEASPPEANLGIEACKAWYDAHQSHPYPTKLEIEQLANTTGLTEQRIKKWFQNQRARQGDAKPRRSSREGLLPSLPPIDLEEYTLASNCHETAEAEMQLLPPVAVAQTRGKRKRELNNKVGVAEEKQR